VLTLHKIEELAQRIERAYLRRQPHWRPGCANPKVWAAAAAALLRMHRSDPTLPLDPELYVAVQPIRVSLADPWEDLTEARSAQRYRRRVHQMIRKLRDELRTEIRLAAARIGQGESVEAVLLSRTRSLSPLGRYIVAVRSGRPDLAERFRRQAHEQHQSCPLYRHACVKFLPRKAYPVLEIVAGMDFPSRAALRIPQFSLN
jgi:hypothetical protein